MPRARFRLHAIEEAVTATAPQDAMQLAPAFKLTLGHGILNAMEEPLVRPATAGTGSFSISKQDIDALVKSQATATEIAAFLTFARFTDETGMFSSAGIKAIKRALGNCGDSVAQKAVKRLQQIQVVYSVTVLAASTTNKGFTDFQGEPLQPTVDSKTSTASWRLSSAASKFTPSLWPS